MKNLELTLSLIDLDEDKEVVISVSGNWHKITGVRQLGGKIQLDVAGSIMCIDKDFNEFMNEKYPKTSFIEGMG